MSALGQKQTSLSGQVRSASLPKADMLVQIDRALASWVENPSLSLLAYKRYGLLECRLTVLRILELSYFVRVRRRWHRLREMPPACLNEIAEGIFSSHAPTRKELALF
jgi:hypothetical protein